MRSLTIGIALYPESETSLAALYNNADIALYDSKNKGKTPIPFTAVNLFANMPQAVATIS